MKEKRPTVVNHYNSYLETAKTEGKFSASPDIQKWVEEISVTALPEYVWTESRSLEMAPFEIRRDFEIRRELYIPDALRARAASTYLAGSTLTGTPTRDHDKGDEDGD